MLNAGPGPSIDGNLVSGTRARYTHQGTDELLEVNKYHLILAFDRLMRRRPKGPRLEHVLMPVLALPGLVLALLPGDFKDYGLKKEIWEAITIILSLACVVVTAVLYAKWRDGWAKYSEPSAEAAVAEILEEMARDREQLASLTSRQARPS